MTERRERPKGPSLYLDDIPSKDAFSGSSCPESSPLRGYVKMRPALAAYLRGQPDPLNLRCDFCDIRPGREIVETLDSEKLLLCPSCYVALNERQ